MWFIYLTNGFQSSVNWTLQPYAVSEWESHSLIPVINVVASSMQAAVFIPLSKILDLWGRAEGFLLMVVMATIGMAMMAGSHNLPTYCAAYVSTQDNGKPKSFKTNIFRSSGRLAGPVSSTASTLSPPTRHDSRTEVSHTPSHHHPTWSRPLLGPRQPKLSFTTSTGAGDSAASASFCQLSPLLCTSSSA